MLRSLLTVAVALLAVAAPAAGAPVALRDDPQASGLALAGPDVLILRDRPSGAQLLAVPRAGGAARVLLSVAGAQATWAHSGDLAASDRRVALYTELRDRHDRTVEWRVYAGPPTGPLQLVRRTPARHGDPWIPLLVDVDGDRVLLVEGKEGDEDALRTQLLDPALGFVPIAWAGDAAAPVAIAGSYAAVAKRDPWRLVVVDQATGTEQAGFALSNEGSEEGVRYDLAADGRIVASGPDGLVTARPGEAAHTLPGTKGMASPRVAGDAIVALDEDRPVVLGLDGSRRTVLGPRSRVFTDLAGDAGGIAWLANGCVRYAAFAAPAGAPATEAPCPSTEIGLYAIASSHLRGHTVHVPVRCVTAPGGTCRGTVLGKLGREVVARGRFAIRAGTERHVPMRVTDAAIARFRRDDSGSLIIGASIPDGRIGVGSNGDSELTIKLD